MTTSESSESSEPSQAPEAQESSEFQRLHSVLHRIGDAFPGFRSEIVEGNIMMSPVKPHHNETIWSLWSTFKAQLPKDWGLTSDVAFLFDDRHELCPDLALIPQEEIDKNLGKYPADLIELVVEVVSASSVRNDYQTKDRVYAARGIPNYLIFDPYEAHCTTLWNPGPDGYVGRDRIPYGTPVTVKTPLGTFTADTGQLPVDPAHKHT